jgi:threonine/homoserine/homoserine lactone efflux protein
MTLVQSLIAFFAAAALIIVTPGLDTVLVLRTATAEGPRRGAAASAGVAMGCLVWGASVALGLGALLAASHAAYSVLKWAGAAYLGWLGLRLLARPRRALVIADEPSGDRGGALGAFRRGLTCNLLNPKAGIFYVSFLPMFVPAGYAVAPLLFLLTVIHSAMSIAWLSGLSLAAGRVRRLLTRRGAVAWLDRVSGCVFLTFGARLALSEL